MRLASHRGERPDGHYHFFDPFRELDSAQLREAVEIARKTMANDPYRRDFDEVLMCEWAKKDGASAMVYVMKHAGVVPDMVMGVWSRVDPEGPWQWYLAERKKDPENSVVFWTVEEVFGGMVLHDPDKAFARLKTLQGAELSAAIAGIPYFLSLELLDRSSVRTGEFPDHVRVLNSADSLPQELRQRVHKTVVSSWVHADPEASVAWVRSRPRGEIDIFRSVMQTPLMNWGSRGVKLLWEMIPESEKPRAYATIAKDWHPGLLSEAMDWAKSIPDEGHRAAAVQAIHARLRIDSGFSTTNAAILAAPARAVEQRARDKQPPTLPQ
jgi:hypothetical protein